MKTIPTGELSVDGSLTLRPSDDFSCILQKNSPFLQTKTGCLLLLCMCSVCPCGLVGMCAGTDMEAREQH